MRALALVRYCLTASAPAWATWPSCGGLAGIRIDDQPIEGKRKTQNAGIDVVPLRDALVRYRQAENVVPFR